MAVLTGAKAMQSLPKERGIYAADGIPLHLRRDMRVRVCRDLDAAMPKALTDNLEMDTCLEESRGMGVPDAMEWHH